MAAFSFDTVGFGSVAWRIEVSPSIATPSIASIPATVAAVAAVAAIPAVSTVTSIAPIPTAGRGRSARGNRRCVRGCWSVVGHARGGYEDTLIIVASGRLAELPRDGRFSVQRLLLGSEGRARIMSQQLVCHLHRGALN